MEKRAENLIWVLVGLVSVIAVVAIVISVLFGSHYANGTFGPYDMMGGYYGMGIVMPIIGVISVIFVIVFVYFIVEALRGPENHYYERTTGQAEAIAKERFARGEISEQEYNSLLEKIRK
jgi:putative membrane protein